MSKEEEELSKAKGIAGVRCYMSQRSLAVRMSTSASLCPINYGSVLMQEDEVCSRLQPAAVTTVENAYLNPGEMAEDGERERDGGVHVRAGDVAGGVDHDGDDEPAGHRLPQLRDALVVLAVDGRRPAGHEHQQERRHHLRDHLPSICTGCVCTYVRAR